VTDVRTQRQRAIAEIIRSGSIGSQEVLAEKLSALGYAVTQATVSRELEQIGAVKSRRNGTIAYSLPEQASRPPAPQLAAILRDWVRSVEAAGSLVVLKTPPGSAHLVGVALDQSDLRQIAGTICGDDTIFVALRGSAEADVLAGQLRSQLA